MWPPVPVQSGHLFRRNAAAYGREIEGGEERVNQELERQGRVARIFPNPASCLRLASALLKEWHHDYLTGRRYLRMELLNELEAEGEGTRSGTLEDAA